MSEKKSITIDSNSLLGGGSSSSKRKSSKRSNGSGSGERKIRPSSIVQPSTLKKTLLERIKQHQRTRERSRAETETQTQSPSESESQPISGGGGRSGNGSGDSSGGGVTDNFSQSIDFLRKLAMKRRQLTQKNHRPHVAPSLSSSTNTPEAQILNTIAPTLQHGEILTNTGLLGLPVVPTLVTEQPSASVSSMPISPVGPSISVGPMPMPMPMPIPAMQTIPTLPPETIVPDIPPKITDLAEMYNNTIAATTPETLSSSSSSSSTNDNTTDSSKEPPLHIPQKPEDYLPSIFIKEEPPHGCLKNGKKPTFREWATKILGGSPPPHDGGAIGGASGDAMTGGSGGASGGAIGGASGGAIGGASGGAMSGSAGDIDPSQIAGMRVKIRKTHKKRYRIGKHDNVVGVLLKNKQTQRHIRSQHLKLRQSSIGEIRKYLYDHHLLKIGSNAPPDVLRRMYEDAILTGDVKNTNDGVMLHNFMSGGSE